MLTKAMRTRRDRASNRVMGRTKNEILLERSSFLAVIDRLLMQQVLEYGMPLHKLAKLHRTSESKLKRRISRLRALLADPCFLLSTQFADHLPADLRSLANSYFVDGLTLGQCGRKHRLTLHHVRQRIATVRSVFHLARVRAAAGSDEDER